MFSAGAAVAAAEPMKLEGEAQLPSALAYLAIGEHNGNVS